MLATLAARWRLVLRRPARAACRGRALARCRPRWRSAAGIDSCSRSRPAVAVAAVAVASSRCSRPRARHATTGTRRRPCACCCVCRAAGPAARALPASRRSPRIATHAHADRTGVRAGHGATGHATWRATGARAGRSIACPAASTSCLRDTAGQRRQSQVAFHVWSQTALSRSRATSDVELYGANRTLVSRFALNVPEYVYRGDGADVAGHLVRLGGVRRGRRGSAPRIAACSTPSAASAIAAGRVRGAVVVHVAPNDYQALPFVVVRESVLRGARRRRRDCTPIAARRSAGGRVRLEPAAAFTSGRVAWPIDRRRSSSGSTTRASRSGRRCRADGRDLPACTSRSDRARHLRARAIPRRRCSTTPRGWPRSPRSSAALFVAPACSARAAYAPFARRRAAPLRVLFHEIRTSFYRKLFLFFVLAAVGPVLLFALAFGAYMTGKFRADVESEAASVVAVARRVFEELAAAEPQRRSGAPAPDRRRDGLDPAGHRPGRQPLRRIASSSRRASATCSTPACCRRARRRAVYRAIALNRLPDLRRGGSPRRVPLPRRGRAGPRRDGHDAVLSVPLALAPARDRARDRRAQPRRARGRGARRVVRRGPRRVGRRARRPIRSPA